MRSILSFILSNLLIIISANQTLAQPYITQGDVPAERGFRTVTLVEGLEHPWSMAWLPNSDILITERPGRLRLVRGGRLISDPVSGISEVFASGQARQRLDSRTGSKSSQPFGQNSEAKR